jgi:hypothetical protein
MDLFKHFSPLREGMRKALSFNAPPVTKPLESATTLFIRTMRLTSVILLAFCLQVSARSDAQQRIAISVKNASLQKLFAEIEKKTNYTFFYDVTILKETKPVSLQFKDATVDEILKQALVGQSLEYTITEKTIFVKKERKAVVETEPADTARDETITVKGVVLTEGGPVQGANVTIKQTEKETITNAKGQLDSSDVQADKVSTTIIVNVNFHDRRLLGIAILLICIVCGSCFLISAYREPSMHASKSLRRWLGRCGVIIDIIQYLGLTYECYELFKAIFG